MERVVVRDVVIELAMSNRALVGADESTQLLRVSFPMSSRRSIEYPRARDSFESEVQTKRKLLKRGVNFTLYLPSIPNLGPKNPSILLRATLISSPPSTVPLSLLL